MVQDIDVYSYNGRPIWSIDRRHFQWS